MVGPGNYSLCVPSCVSKTMCIIFSAYRMHMHACMCAHRADVMQSVAPCQNLMAAVWRVSLPPSLASSLHPSPPLACHSGACEKNTPPEKRTCGQIILKNTKSGLWSSFCRWMAGERLLQGECFFHGHRLLSHLSALQWSVRAEQGALSFPPCGARRPRVGNDGTFSRENLVLRGSYKARPMSRLIYLFQPIIVLR